MRPSCCFDILPAKETDCSTLARIEQRAIDHAVQGDEQRSIVHLMFGPFNAKAQASRGEDLARQMQTDPTVEFHKAVLSDGGAEHGKIVAWAQWHYYLDPRPVEEWKNKDWPASRNPDACNEFLGAVAAARNTHMSGQRYGLLAVLMTLPEHQGQGIGSALLEFGLAKAKEKGLTQFWLEASTVGYKLYQKFGFKDADNICMDLTKYGGIGKEDVVCMRVAC